METQVWKHQLVACCYYILCFVESVPRSANPCKRPRSAKKNGSSLTEPISDAAAEDVRLDSPHKSCIKSLHPESSRDADAESAIVPGHFPTPPEVKQQLLQSTNVIAIHREVAKLSFHLERIQILLIIKGTIQRVPRTSV